MQVYTTPLEVAKAIREKFADETELNRVGFMKGCRYAPTYNQVGCAIGCLLPLEMAYRMDEYGSPSMIYFYSSDYKGVGAIKEELSAIFPGIDSYALNKFQSMHDRAEDVADFLNQLDAYINGLEE